LDRTRPDAIFCANDLMAVGCYEALKERGEQVGKTIGVMGYDDQEIAQHLNPPCRPYSCHTGKWRSGAPRNCSRRGTLRQNGTGWSVPPF
jgi:hypothetical protein